LSLDVGRRREGQHQDNLLFFLFPRPHTDAAIATSTQRQFHEVFVVEKQVAALLCSIMLSLPAHTAAGFIACACMNTVRKNFA